MNPDKLVQYERCLLKNETTFRVMLVVDGLACLIFLGGYFWGMSLGEKQPVLLLWSVIAALCGGINRAQLKHIATLKRIKRG